MNKNQILTYRVTFDKRQYIYTANSISVSFADEINIGFIDDLKDKIYEKLPKTITIDSPSANELKIMADIDYSYWSEINAILNEQLPEFEESRKVEIGFENFDKNIDREPEGIVEDDQLNNQQLLGTSSFLIRLEGELTDEIKNQLGPYLKIEENVIPNLHQVFFSNEFDCSISYKNLYSLKQQQNIISNIEPVFNIVWFSSSLLSTTRKRGFRRHPIIEDQDTIINQKASELINFKTDKLYGDRDIQIAILDHHIELNHTAFKQIKIKTNSKDFINEDVSSGLEKEPKEYIAHGIACAGLAVGYDNKGIGEKPFAGFAAGCSLVNAVMIGVKNDKEYTNSNAILKALEYAAYEMEVDVISCSWKIDFESDEIKNKIDEIVNKGVRGKTIPVVVSAVNNTKYQFFPAKLESVITVGAVDRNGKYINERYNKKYKSGWYSYEGSIVDITAPGRFLISTDNQDGIKKIKYNGIPYPIYSRFYGTSAATPIVAAFIAILKSNERRSKKKPLTASQIKSYISKPENVTLPKNWNTNLWGSGIINFEKLLKK